MASIKLTHDNAVQREIVPLIVQSSNCKSLRKKWGGSFGCSNKAASNAPLLTPLKWKNDHQNVWWEIQSRKVAFKNSTSHLPLAKSTSEHIQQIFQHKRSVVHHSAGQTCMLLHCNTSQSELHAAEAKNLTSCTLP